MLRIGIRAHDMGKYTYDNLENLGSLIKESGGCSIQLALKKVISDFQNLSEKLTPELGKELKEKFNKYNLDIAVLGSYINMANPDSEVRTSEIKKFKEHLFLAKYLGNPLVGTETGSYTRDYSYTELNSTEEALNVFYDTLIQIVDEAEKIGSTVAIEGVAKHIISTPEKMKEVLDKIQSENLQVIFDPVNFLNIDNYLEQDRIIKKSFQLFGNKIKIVHLKDFTLENGYFKVVPPGQGLLNVKLILECLKKENPLIDVLLENSNPQSVKDYISHLQELFKKI